MAEVKYFRSSISGLTVITGDVTAEDAEKGDVAPKSVRFSPFEERVRGEKVVVGYLSTDNMTAIKKLATDPNVEEIKQKEFDEATGDKAKPAAA